MATFSDSWALTRNSFRMIREDPALLALPAIAGLALFGIILVLTLPLVAAFLLNPSGFLSFTGTRGGQAVLVLLYLVGYFVLVFVGNFFTAALIGAAMMKLDGGQPTVGDGIRFARQRLVRLLVWSLIAATVGLLIRALSARFRGLGGVILGLVAGATWAIATYFAIPVIVFEQRSPWQSLKRSASLYLHTFGRTFVSNIILALIVFGFVILGAVLFIIGVALAVANGAVLVGLGLVLAGLAVWIFGAVLATALSGILRASLYRYATTGKISPELLPPGLRPVAPPPESPPSPPPYYAPPLPSGRA